MKETDQKELIKILGRCGPESVLSFIAVYIGATLDKYNVSKTERKDAFRIYQSLLTEEKK